MRLNIFRAIAALPMVWPFLLAVAADQVNNTSPTLPPAPPDFQATVSRGTSVVPGAIQPALDLSPDERALARILLRGSFDTEDAKVAAFDEAHEYLGRLSHGRLYDLVNGLLQKESVQNGTAGPLAGIFMKDQQVARKFRRSLLFSLAEFADSGLDAKSIAALRNASDAYMALQALNGDEKKRAELMLKLKEVQERAGGAMTIHDDAMRAWNELRAELSDDSGLTPQAREELRAILDEAGIGELFGLAQSTDGIGSDVLREYELRIKRLKQVLHEDASTLDGLIGSWDSFIAKLSERARNGGRTGAAYKDVLDQALRFTWGGGDFDLIANWEKFLKDHPGVATAAQVREIRRSLAANSGLYQSFFGELNDIRNFVFNDPLIRKEYQATVFHSLLELIEYDPGNVKDSLVVRLQNMAEVIRQSGMPEATKIKLVSRVLELAGVADRNVMEFRVLFGYLSKMRQSLLASGAEYSLSTAIFGLADQAWDQVALELKTRILALRAKLARIPGAVDLLSQLNEIDSILAEVLSAPDSLHAIGDLLKLKAYVTEHPELGKILDAELLKTGTLRDAAHVRVRRTLARIDASHLPKKAKKRLHTRAAGIDEKLRSSASDFEKARAYMLDMRGAFESDTELRRLLGSGLSEKIDALMTVDPLLAGRTLASRIAEIGTKIQTQPISRKSKVEVLSHFEPTFLEGVKQIESIADKMVASGQIQIWTKEYQALFKIIFREYYRRTQLKYKKEMLLELLDLPAEAGFVDQLGEIIQGSGPEIQKLIQLFSKEKSTGQDLKQVAELLESGVKHTPFDQIHRTLLERIPDIYPSRFKSIDHVPVNTGTMAQLHRAEIIQDDGSVAVRAVRVIKPGVKERVADDDRIMKEITPIVSQDPEIRGTALERFENFIGPIHVAVENELLTLPTALNQIRGGEIYTGTLNRSLKRLGNVSLHVRVPKLYNLNSLDSGVLINELVKGVKPSKFFQYDPATYRAVAEEVVQMWAKEALFGSGFFHMDLHQGNIMVTRGDDGGIVLTLIDFGMASSFTPDQRAAFLKLNTAANQRNVAKLTHAIEVLLADPLPHDQLLETVERVMQRKGSTVFEVLDAVLKMGAKVPNAIVDFNRGKWFIEQLLTESGSKETVDTLMTRVARREILKELPSRLWSKIRRQEDIRPATGVPLTNAELKDLLRSEITQCVRNRLKVE